MSTNVHLTPELERFAKACVAASEALCASDALVAAIDLLTDPEMNTDKASAQPRNARVMSCLFMGGVGLLARGKGDDEREKAIRGATRREGRTVVGGNDACGLRASDRLRRTSSLNAKAAV